MEARELRIGNWVSVKDSLHKISVSVGMISRGTISLVAGDLGSRDFDIQMLAPIPLTEDWLMKFGFGKLAPSYSGDDTTFSIRTEAIGDCDSFYVVKDGFYDKKGEVVFNWCTWDFNEGVEEHELTNRIQCRFVHQLQNLYFTLTGEELVLNKSLKITYEEYGVEGSKVTLTKN